MKILLGFLLGVTVATVGQLWAQSQGIFLDDQGRAYQYGTMPGGSVNVWGQHGEQRTFFQEQGTNRNPC